MFRIVDMTVNSIVFDPVAASEALNRTARPHGNCRAVGIAPVGDRLLIFLEEDANAFVFRFAPLEDGPAAAEVAAEVKARYYAGFSTVGVFSHENRNWALFAMNLDK